MVGVEVYWGDVHIDPDVKRKYGSSSLHNIINTMNVLLDKYNDATIIRMTIGSMNYDEMDYEKSNAVGNAIFGLKHIIRDFVKSNWGIDPEIIINFFHMYYQAINLIIIIFGVQSLIKEEDISKILDAEGVKYTRNLMKRSDEAEELATKILFSKWLAERLEQVGLKDILENFKKSMIEEIEVYSVKDKKWTGKKPIDGHDNVVIYLAVKTFAPL